MHVAKHRPDWGMYFTAQKLSPAHSSTPIELSLLGPWLLSRLTSHSPQPCPHNVPPSSATHECDWLVSKETVFFQGFLLLGKAPVMWQDLTNVSPLQDLVLLSWLKFVPFSLPYRTWTDSWCEIHFVASFPVDHELLKVRVSFSDPCVCRV